MGQGNVHTSLLADEGCSEGGFGFEISSTWSGNLYKNWVSGDKKRHK